MAVNTFLPHFIRSKAFLLLAVALIGTTITPYIQLYTAGAVVDRGIGPEEYKYERVDAVSGAIVSDLVSMCIIIATAAVIGGTGALNSAADAAKALAPLAGRCAETLFGIGLLGASALAAAVVPLSTSYAVAEAVGVERSVSKSFRQAPLFLGLFTAQIIIGAGVVLVPGNLFQPDHQHPDPRGRAHPDHAGVHPGAGQSPVAAGRSGQRKAGADGRSGHRGCRRRLRHLSGLPHRPRVDRDLPVIEVVADDQPSPEHASGLVGLRRSTWPGEYLPSMCLLASVVHA